MMTGKIKMEQVTACSELAFLDPTRNLLNGTKPNLVNTFFIKPIQITLRTSHFS